MGPEDNIFLILLDGKPFRIYAVKFFFGGGDRMANYTVTYRNETWKRTVIICFLNLINNL